MPIEELWKRMFDLQTAEAFKSAGALAVQIRPSDMTSPETLAWTKVHSM